jgi:hypothetical protein
MKSKICISCRNKFKPTSNNQLYCEKVDCQKFKITKTKERVRKYGNEWYWKNRDRILERQKLYRKNNPDYYKNKSKEVVYKYNHSAKGIFNVLKKRCVKENKSKLQITQKQFIEWYQEQEKKCVYCDIHEDLVCLLNDKTSYPITRLTIDRKDNNLPYTINNIGLACFKCNSLKKNFFTFKEMREIAQKYIKSKWEVLNG